MLEPCYPVGDLFVNNEHQGEAKCCARALEQEAEGLAYAMALSARILALIQKIEAADAEHFARLRESAKKDADARAKTLEKKRANLRVARAVQARTKKTARS
jgi:hypothetical protein